MGARRLSQFTSKAATFLFCSPFLKGCARSRRKLSRFPKASDHQRRANALCLRPDAALGRAAARPHRAGVDDDCTDVLDVPMTRSDPHALIFQPSRTDPPSIKGCVPHRPSFSHHHHSYSTHPRWPGLSGPKARPSRRCQHHVVPEPYCGDVCASCTDLTATGASSDALSKMIRTPIGAMTFSSKHRPQSPHVVPQISPHKSSPKIAQ